LKTRYEKFYHIKPDVSILVPFYSSGYYNLTAEERQHFRIPKLGPQAKSCYMIGLSKVAINSYLILDKQTNQVLVRKDCIFPFYPTISEFPRIDPFDYSQLPSFPAEEVNNNVTVNNIIDNHIDNNNSATQVELIHNENNQNNNGNNGINNINQINNEINNQINNNNIDNNNLIYDNNIDNTNDNNLNVYPNDNNVSNNNVPIVKGLLTGPGPPTSSNLNFYFPITEKPINDSHFVRRSTRQIQPINRWKACSMKTSNVINTKITIYNAHILCPKNMREAFSSNLSEEWHAAYLKEMHAIIIRNTFS